MKAAPMTLEQMKKYPNFALFVSEIYFGVNTRPLIVEKEDFTVVIDRDGVEVHSKLKGEICYYQCGRGVGMAIIEFIPENAKFDDFSYFDFEIV